MNFKSKFNYKKTLKISIILILIIGILIYELNFKKDLTKVELVIKDTYYSVLNIIKTPFLKKYEPNKTDEIKGLETIITEQDKTIKELEQLSNIVVSEYKYINAVVIDRNPLFYNNTLVINKGTNDGLLDDSLVVTNYVLIGITKNCSSNFCEVELLTNNNKINDLSVYITKDDDYIHGILTGYDTLEDELLVSNVTNNKSEYDGYKIITSGLSNYPKGILIGEVIGTYKGKYELENMIRIKASTDYTNISFVQVIVRGDTSDN